MRLLIIAVALIGGFGLIGYQMANLASDEPMGLDGLPTAELEMYPGWEDLKGENHPCYQKRRCLVSYIAPWCPACKKSLPLINATAEYLNAKGEAGMVVVVGSLGSSWKGHKKMASRITAPLYVDGEASLWRSTGGAVEGTPGWLTYDGKGNVIAGETGGFRRSSQHAVNRVLDRAEMGEFKSTHSQ